jgi:hypothetical protein
MINIISGITSSVVLRLNKIEPANQYIIEILDWNTNNLITLTPSNISEYTESYDLFELNLTLDPGTYKYTVKGDANEIIRKGELFVEKGPEPDLLYVEDDYVDDDYV